MLFEGPLQWCRLSAGAWRSHMSAQNPVGVIPASKTVRRTVEVAVLRSTLENCTLDCMRRANVRTETCAQKHRLGSEDEPGRYCEVAGPCARCRRPRHLGCFRCSSDARQTHPAVLLETMPRAETLERVVSWPDAARLRRVRVLRDYRKFDRREARHTALKSDGHTERVGYERSTEHQRHPGFSPLSH
jgi:hypothetical protein